MKHCNKKKSSITGVKVQFLSHLEVPDASRLLPPAVHCHQGPVFQAGSGGVIGPRVQQQRYSAGWRLQAYGEVTATHAVDAHSHLVRNRWHEIKEKGGVNKEIEKRDKETGRKRERVEAGGQRQKDM